MSHDSHQRYTVVLHRDSYQRAERYLRSLQHRSKEPGLYLKRQINRFEGISVVMFLEKLVQTKSPQIFAESQVSGDGLDWNMEELRILGDVCIAAAVTVYDNGRHSMAKVHPEPFEGTLLFVAGALLRSRGRVPADWNEAVNKDGTWNKSGYFRLYERRLLPAFLHANAVAASSGCPALVTIPGLGCGQFAGPFHGLMGKALQGVLTKLLEKYHEELPHIRAVYYDPYGECSNSRHEIGHIAFLVRPLLRGNESKPQLCSPSAFADENKPREFDDCSLFSIVAWDHVSWPGNDYYLGARMTDDGVKAAATSVMFSMTGVEGKYNKRLQKYKPPSPYKTWGQLVEEKDLRLHVADRLAVYPMVEGEDDKTPG